MADRGDGLGNIERDHDAELAEMGDALEQADVRYYAMRDDRDRLQVLANVRAERLAAAVDLIREAAEIAGRPLTTADEDLYGRVVVIGSKLRTALRAYGGQ